MKTLVFHSFWIATDLIRCPMVLGKIFEPPRVHRGCTGGVQWGCIGCWIWGLRESKLQLWIYIQNLLFLPNLDLVWPQFDPAWSIWLILCQLCCKNELSVAFFHQNLKLGAGLTLKNGYMSINITGWSACALPMGPRIQYAHGMWALIYL